VRCGHDIQNTLKDAGFTGDFYPLITPYCQGPVTNGRTTSAGSASYALADAQNSDAGAARIGARGVECARLFGPAPARGDCARGYACNTVTYELATKQFGIEKGVDTQLATDMIVLADIYDAAIILSGDADYLPAVAAVKAKGRLVYSVSFLGENGKPLPGGARRLRNAVDSRVDLPFDAMRGAMRIEPRVRGPLLTVATRLATTPSM
jgi:hypothetical protein